MIEILSRRFSFIPIKKQGSFLASKYSRCSAAPHFWVTQAAYKLVTAGVYQFCR
jgi:hypothetical protein